MSGGTLLQSVLTDWYSLVKMKELTDAETFLCSQLDKVFVTYEVHISPLQDLVIMGKLLHQVLLLTDEYHIRMEVVAKDGWLWITPQKIPVNSQLPKRILEVLGAFGGYSQENKSFYICGYDYRELPAINQDPYVQEVQNLMAFTEESVESFD